MSNLEITATRLFEIRDLYGYNRWANERVFEATSRLTHEELTRDLRSSFPSVLGTLVHMVSAEWVWLERWNGRSPRSIGEFGDYRTHAAIHERWTQLEREQRAFLDALTDARLDDMVQYTQMSGAAFAQPLWQLLRHVVNHASYHRGQVTTLLRQLGHEPVSTDLVVYYRQPG